MGLCHGYREWEKTETTPNTAVQEWILQEQQAKSELLLLIASTELKQVKDCTTAEDIWKKLKTIYQSKGPARKATLLKHLLLKKLKEGEDIRDHLQHFDDTVDKLRQMDVELDNDLLSIMILYSLPSDYENFRIAIETRDELLLPDVLKIKVIDEYETRHKDDKEDKNKTTEKAFVSKHFNENKNCLRGDLMYGSTRIVALNYNEKSKLRCYKCEKLGHRAIDCWSKNSKH